MKKSTARSSSDDNLYDLIRSYNTHKDDKRAHKILAKLTESTQNTFQYILSKSLAKITSDFMVKKDAIIATANACWVAVTEEGFIDNFIQWKDSKTAARDSSLASLSEEELFTRYIGNLAARIIYKLSRDEFFEYYSLFSRKRTIHYLEDLKVQLSGSPLLEPAGKMKGAAKALSENCREEEPPSHFLDENNSFIMQAFNMIENAEFRDTLYKYDVKGISLTEIAREKNKDYSLIRQWHKRALARLKKNLDKILTGPWGTCYFKALEELKQSYSTMEEPYKLRLQLLEMNLQGISLADSLNEFIERGLFPRPDKMELVTITGKFEKVINSIKDYPFMDERLYHDENFKVSLYNELKKKKEKEDIVKYIFHHTLRYQLQQTLWALYETFKECAEMPSHGSAKVTGASLGAGRQGSGECPK